MGLTPNKSQCSEAVKVLFIDSVLISSEQSGGCLFNGIENVTWPVIVVTSHLIIHLPSEYDSGV